MLHHMTSSSWVLATFLLGLLLLNKVSLSHSNPVLDLYELNENNDEDIIDKRAGFVGMRGKKYAYEGGNDEDAFDTFAKRAGFVGMRGKKSFETTPEALPVTDQEQELMDMLRAMHKRRPQFMGMRGKKSDDDENDDELIEEYAPSKRAGFVGMRGKKKTFNYAVPTTSWNRLFGVKSRRGGSMKGFVGMRG